MQMTTPLECPYLEASILDYQLSRRVHVFPKFIRCLKTDNEVALITYDLSLTKQGSYFED
jgi:hypothetical protein